MMWSESVKQTSMSVCLPIIIMISIGLRLTTHESGYLLEPSIQYRGQKVSYTRCHLHCYKYEKQNKMLKHEEGEIGKVAHCRPKQIRQRSGGEFLHSESGEWVPMLVWKCVMISSPLVQIWLPSTRLGLSM